jgi:hypothetical protein
MIKTLRFIAFLIFIQFNARSVVAQEADTIADTSIVNLKKNTPELWYVDSLPPKVKKTLDTNKVNSEKLKIEEQKDNTEWIFPFLNFLKWLFIVALIFGVFYLIFKGNFKFNFKRTKNSRVDEIITENTKIENEEQLQNISFEGQIIDAENNKNYRLAVRLYYLWVIKLLVEKNQIKFHIDKTNQDYCNEMRTKTNYEAFKTCTNYYNYVWFGEFLINDNSYNKITDQFKTLIANIV